MLRPLQKQEYLAFRALFIEGYVIDLQDNKGYDRATALQISANAISDDFSKIKGQLAVIEYDNHLVGYLWYVVNELSLSAYILDFMVLPEHQGKGYGTRALAELEQQLLAQQIQFIELRVAADNPRAKKLYQTLSFAVSGFNMIKRLGER